jgi:transposase InsO family protein
MRWVNFRNRTKDAVADISESNKYRIHRPHRSMATHFGYSTACIKRHRKVYRTRAQARADVFDFIEAFYNPKRRHSTIGYISPVKFEEALFA